MITTLDTLESGDNAVIVGYKDCSKSDRKKLLSLGLTPGTEVVVFCVAPFGDPLGLELRGYQLSVRKDEAKRIEIDK